MTTLTGYVMTLANSIIGVSLLAMPYCFKQCGLVLAVLLLLLSSIVTRLACHYLVKSAVMCRRTSFQLLAYHVFGRSGKLMIEIGVIGFLLGTCVAYFVVIGDLAPAILARLFHLDNNSTLRFVVLIVSGSFIVLPLSLLRNIESLAAISTVTMLFYALLTVKLFAESFSHLAAADWTSSVNYWRPEGVLQCFPIFAMALSCQTQIFEILEVLPNATLERMNGVVRSAVGLCSGFYIAIGFLGYVAYAREPIGGNVLLSFSSSLSSDLFQLGFVASVALSFPLVVFPCRASLHSLLSKRVPTYHDPSTQATYIADARFKWLTLCIVTSALVIGLLVPNIEFVLGFVGSTIGVATCIIFPASVFVNISNKDTSERLLAKAILALGFIVMILGTFVNIETASDRQIVLPSQPLVRMQDGIGGSIELPPRIDVPPAVNSLEFDAIKKNVEPAAKVNKPEGAAKRVEPPIPQEPVIEIKKQDISSPKKSKPKAVDAGQVIDLGLDVKNSKKLDVKEPDVLVNHAENGGGILKPENTAPLMSLPSIDTVRENPSGNNSLITKTKENKQKDTIHEDALAKEDKELLEDHNQKNEEERKQQELLDKLKEHQEEQKKLLQEQQNILDEIKIRDELKDHQKEQKKLLEEQQIILDEIKIRNELKDRSKAQEKLSQNNGERVNKIDEPKNVPQKLIDTNSKVVPNEEKQIPQYQQNVSEAANALARSNVEHNNKMQEVIHDLKERKQVLDKTKGVKIAEDKKRVAGKKEITGKAEDKQRIAEKKEISDKQPKEDVIVPRPIEESLKGHNALLKPLLKQIKLPKDGVENVVLTAKEHKIEKRDADQGVCDKAEEGKMTEKYEVVTSDFKSDDTAQSKSEIKDGDQGLVKSETLSPTVKPSLDFHDNINHSQEDTGIQISVASEKENSASPIPTFDSNLVQEDLGIKTSEILSSPEKEKFGIPSVPDNEYNKIPQLIAGSKYTRRKK